MNNEILRDTVKPHTWNDKFTQNTFSLTRKCYSLSVQTAMEDAAYFIKCHLETKVKTAMKIHFLPPIFPLLFLDAHNQHKT
jgi:hypothetical protein